MLFLMLHLLIQKMHGNIILKPCCQAFTFVFCFRYDLVYNNKNVLLFCGKNYIHYQRKIYQFDLYSAFVFT